MQDVDVLTAQTDNATRLEDSLLLDRALLLHRPQHLAHVAAGRYDAFVEPHMHPWDASAGLLLVEEAGGRVRPYPGGDGLIAGGAVIAATPRIFEPLSRIADASGGF